MKKILLFMLGIALLGMVGCSKKNADTESEENCEVASDGDAALSATVEETAEDNDLSADVTETTVDDAATVGNVQGNFASGNSQTQQNQQSDISQQDAQQQSQHSNQTQSQQSNQQTQQQSTQAESPQQNTEYNQAAQSISYSPERVVSLAIEKCRAGGMITTEEQLKNSLESGKITQEEYDEYYPLDGLEGSYYSVFINVDLNKAETVSSQKLSSEEEIAQYIADMLLLETNPVFNIRCVGTTQTTGETFYEFRCYR